MTKIDLVIRAIYEDVLIRDKNWPEGHHIGYEEGHWFSAPCSHYVLDMDHPLATDWEIYEKPKEKKYRVKTLLELLESGWKVSDTNGLRLNFLRSSYSFSRELIVRFAGERIDKSFKRRNVSDDADADADVLFHKDGCVFTKDMLVEIDD